MRAIVLAFATPAQRGPGKLKGAHAHASRFPTRPARSVNAAASALGELEALAGALAAVLLPLLHPAVAGEVAGIAELLGHGDNGLVGGLVRLRLGGVQAEHTLQSAGDALRAGAGLAGEAAAGHLD